MFKRFLAKVAILFLVFSLPVIGVTNSSYMDKETSNGNNFRAESLDFSLRDTGDVILTSPFFNLSGFRPGDSQAKTLRVKKDGGLDFKYDGRFVKTGGDTNFCQALQLEAKLGGVMKYDGNLDGFNLTPALTIGSSGQDDWEFILSMNNDDPVLQNKTCQFNFVFKGWQLDSNGTWGFLDEETLGNSISSGDWTAPPPPPSETSNVVINEFLPDPLGADDAAKPGGEWVELYNKSDSEVNVDGWYLYDDYNTHALPIGASRTNTGNTIVPPHGFLVIYRNGDGDFSLDQDAGGDRVRLFTKRISVGGVLVDSHTYTGTVPEGKSIARFPDGSDTWFDPIPTPGGPNKLEEGPTVDFSLRSDKRAVSFSVNNIKKFKTLSYEITYDAKPEAKQIAGTAELTNEDSFSRNNLILGTCSSLGEVCVYDWGMTKITLRVVLTLANGQTTEIIKEIAYY